MSGLYDCDECDWENPAVGYGLAEMGAEWASHLGREHRPRLDDSDAKDSA